MNFAPRLLILTLLFFFGTAVTAQAQPTAIRSTTVTYDKQEVPALQTAIKPPRKDLQDAFDDWMDDTYDINMKGGGLFSDKNLRNAEGVSLAPVSADPINLYTKTIETKSETEMYLFATRGKQNYIGPENATAFRGLEQVFDEFLSYYLPEYYEQRVTEATEMLEDLRDDLADLRDDISDKEKKIQELRKENIDLEAEAGELEKKIRDAESQLDERRAARQRISQQVKSGGR